MQQRPTQTDLYRWGGMAAVVGGLIGIVFNLLHPRSSGSIADDEAFLRMVADSDIWRIDHIALGLAVALGLIGVIAIALSMAGTAGDGWARTWLIFAAVSSAVLIVLLAMDGTAIKAAATNWTTTNDPGALAAATVLNDVTQSLLGASMAMFFGISPLLLSKAVMTSGAYPKPLGQAAMAAGVLGLITALAWAFQGLAEWSTLYLFPVASLLSTVVLMWAGWELYKKADTLGSSAGTTTVPKTDTSVTPGL